MPAIGIAPAYTECHAKYNATSHKGNSTHVRSALQETYSICFKVCVHVAETNSWLSGTSNDFCVNVYIVQSGCQFESMDCIYTREVDLAVHGFKSHIQGIYPPPQWNKSKQTHTHANIILIGEPIYTTKCSKSLGLTTSYKVLFYMGFCRMIWVAVL